MTPREAGIQAFYADESTTNTLQGLNAAFDAYEAADIMQDSVAAGANGGPAFAALATSPMGDVHHQEGMSLRDWYRGQALAGLCANPGGPFQANEINGWNLVNCTAGDVAMWCNELANAMIAMRSKAKEA